MTLKKSFKALGDDLVTRLATEALSYQGKLLLAGALLELVKKSRAIAPVDCVPVPQRPQVYLGEQYVNNPMLSDVTFLVEGQQFHAHRIALLASSDTFRAMFDGNYIEKDASSIPIPNIRYAVFHAMMLCIYTGEPIPSG